MIALRPAVTTDAHIVARIYIESWNQGFGHLLGMGELTPERVARWEHDLSDDGVDWTIAEADGVVVGFVGVGPSRDPVDPMLGELDTIAVDPAHWRVGIGRALMNHALAVLRSSWCTAILWTPARYERGHAFYRATGWELLHRTRADGQHVAFGRDLSVPRSR